ncbi:MAG: hypothetical protein ACI86H_000279 [bacterium]|jgi:hypothetical protein
MIKKLSSIFPILFLVLLLSSCEPIVVDVVSQPPSYLLDKPKDAKNQDLESRKGKSIAIFPILSLVKTPKPVLTKLNQFIINEIKTTRLFERILSGSKLNVIIDQDGTLSQKKDIYLDTFSVVSVSDMDLSAPIGKELGVDSFLIFQVNSWPCEKCIPKDLLRMKLRLVQASTGNVVWTGIHEEYGVSLNSNLENIAKKVAAKLTYVFYHRFKTKWHKQRYQNLTLLGKK